MYALELSLDSLNHHLYDRTRLKGVGLVPLVDPHQNRQIYIIFRVEIFQQQSGVVSHGPNVDVTLVLDPPPLVNNRSLFYGFYSKKLEDLPKCFIGVGRVFFEEDDEHLVAWEVIEPIAQKHRIHPQMKSTTLYFLVQISWEIFECRCCIQH